MYVLEVPIGEINDANFEAEVFTFLGLYEARFFDDRMSVLGDARQVQIKTENSFLERDYDDSELSLFGALSFKPIENSLIYIQHFPL